MLTDKIAQLRDESITALDASHDYYAHTKHAWRFMQGRIWRGTKISIQNDVTGNVANEQELSDLSQEYVTGYLTSATFQHFVSVFEDFIFGFLQAWLTEYPESLKSKQVEFQTVYESNDKDEIVQAVVQREVHEWSRAKIDVWFKKLNKIAELGCPDQDQIERLAEIKTSRDILVHAKGIANSIYVDKSMGLARFKSGERLEIPEDYHRESWELIKQVILDVAEAGIKKFDE